MVAYDSWGEKPLPLIDAESREYWERAAAGEFVIQSCDECGELQFYPRSVCRHCWSDSVSFIEHDGMGSVYSFTVNHIPGAAGYAEETPYVVGLIELAAGESNPSGRPVRMTSHLVNCATEDIEVGMPVQVTFRDIQEEPQIALPVFEPA